MSQGEKSCHALHANGEASAKVVTRNLSFADQSGIGKLEIRATFGQQACTTARLSLCVGGSMLSRWFGYYNRSVLRNGWQPFDQPDPVAYMPLPFSEFRRLETERGAILIQAGFTRRRLGDPMGGRMFAEKSHDFEECRLALLSLLREQGVDEPNVEGTIYRFCEDRPPEIISPQFASSERIL